jgi:hypothetical protein
MDSKEKADYLIRQMTVDFSMELEQSKLCAIVAVNEILNSSPSLPILGDGGYLYEDIELSKNYWQEVKSEIEKI